jgi:ribosomal protein L40E
MRKLFSAGSYIEAQLLRGYLEHSGIQVEIVNENSSGAPGSPHWALPVAAEIWVLDDASHSEAASLVKEYFDAQANETEVEWTCRKCNESNPGSFELCWKCGHVAA